MRVQPVSAGISVFCCPFRLRHRFGRVKRRPGPQSEIPEASNTSIQNSDKDQTKKK